jgi:hypothetical protein
LAPMGFRRWGNSKRFRSWAVAAAADDAVPKSDEEEVGMGLRIVVSEPFDELPSGRLRIHGPPIPIDNSPSIRVVKVQNPAGSLTLPEDEQRTLVPVLAVGHISCGSQTEVSRVTNMVALPMIRSFPDQDEAQRN